MTPQQLQLWTDRESTLEQICLSNKILRATKLPPNQAIGSKDRYSIALRYEFPMQFYRAEVEHAIALTDPWTYPNVKELQECIEWLCRGELA